MSMLDNLIHKNIPPKFWPPMGENGELVSKWLGRRRDNPDRNSFAAFRTQARRSGAGKNHLARHHGEVYA